MKPKRLGFTEKLNGHTYELFRRSDLVACYKQFSDDLLVGYELFIIPIRKKETIKGVTYPLRECFPSTSNWSQRAWTLGTYHTEEQVIARWEELDREIRSKLDKK